MEESFPPAGAPRAALKLPLSAATESLSSNLTYIKRARAGASRDQGAVWSGLRLRWTGLLDARGRGGVVGLHNEHERRGGQHARLARPATQKQKQKQKKKRS